MFWCIVRQDTFRGLADCIITRMIKTKIRISPQKTPMNRTAPNLAQPIVSPI